MRRCLALLLVSTLAAVPAAAQQFEGTVHMKMTGMNSGSGTGDMNVTYYLKSGRMAMEMLIPAGSQMAGQQVRMIYDQSSTTMTVLVPTSAEMMGRMGGMGNGVKGIKMVLDMSKVVPDSSMVSATTRKLGTSETIAGYPCDDYAVTSKNETTTVCVTQALGQFVYPVSGMGRGRPAPPAWTEVFGKHGFPLKATMPDGQGTMEVTAVDKSTVPDSVFAIPGDYMDMSGMMGGRGGGGR